MKSETSTAFLHRSAADTIDYVARFTAKYKHYSENEIERRELACLRVQFPYILQDIEPDDLFAGRIHFAPIGFSPQSESGYGYYLNEKTFQKVINDAALTQMQKLRAQHLYNFWRKENTKAKIIDSLSDQIQTNDSIDNSNDDSGISLSLCHLAMPNLNYGALLKLGVNGLCEHIISQQNNTDTDSNVNELYAAMHLALELLRDVCLWYAEAADIQAINSIDPQISNNYARIAESLNHIAYFAPEDFHQSIQLFWIYSLLAGNSNYGRIDVWAVDAYTRDMAQNSLLKDDAQKMFISLWRLMHEREQKTPNIKSQITVGGKGRNSENYADELALLCIESAQRMQGAGPKLIVRYYADQNIELYEKALELSQNNNFNKNLYDDDNNNSAKIETLTKSNRDLLKNNSSPCREFCDAQNNSTTANSQLNMLSLLFSTLTNAIEPTRNAKNKTLTSKDSPFKTFEELYSAYLARLTLHVHMYVEQIMLHHTIVGKTASFIFPSILIDCCITKGCGVFNGGTRIQNAALEICGHDNAAQYLLALKIMIYEEQKITLTELIKMLQDNFDTVEQIKQRLKIVPTYNTENISAMQKKLHTDVCNLIRRQARQSGFRSFHVREYSGKTRIFIGACTNASPSESSRVLVIK
jgi:hypothetical protein